MQVREAIIRLKKIINPSERAKTFREAKSTAWSSLKKKECTGQLSSAKRPERPQKVIEVDDDRIIIMVEKNNFTASNQVKNTLEEVEVSLRSGIERKCDEWKCRRNSS